MNFGWKIMNLIHWKLQWILLFLVRYQSYYLWKTLNSKHSFSLRKIPQSTRNLKATKEVKLSFFFHMNCIKVLDDAKRKLGRKYFIQRNKQRLYSYEKNNSILSEELLPGENMILCIHNIMHLHSTKGVIGSLYMTNYQMIFMPSVEVLLMRNQFFFVDCCLFRCKENLQNANNVGSEFLLATQKE